MGRDFYRILGVQRDSTASQLKKAYRKLALKFHPDKNKSAGAEERFKDINEAYSVLSDDSKKRIYDLYGEEGLQGGPSGSQESKDGTPGPFGGMGGMGRGGNFFYTTSGNGVGSGFGGFANANDIFASFFGTSNPFEAGSDSDGDHPMGMGGEFSFGHGRFPHVGPLHQKQQQRPKQNTKRNFECSLEQLYKGTTKRMRVTRDSDSKESIELQIDVRPGWKEGTKITFPEVRDVTFVLKERAHSRFTRRGNDLIFRASVSLEDALVGAHVTVITLDDRVLDVDIDQIITPGFTKVLRGEGMPISKSTNGACGDLIIEFDIQFPRQLSRRQKRKLSAAFADEG